LRCGVTGKVILAIALGVEDAATDSQYDVSGIDNTPLG
jgi:hypothetical protein